eukprot:TRINITY_DN1467_c1_g1_i1.p1 TRINITY_DN1467_c1_g1~~TRINITY_DN1467_c1_g1_i1.p1  ORF type:complete len:187 (+),score=81.50 TRINITY_DN1467_c1_g1_i1:43-603(+)
MGIDIRHKHAKKNIRTFARSQDPYRDDLVKIYRFLARRTSSDFNKTILKRLYMSKTNIPPMSLSKVVVNMRGHKEEEIACIVGAVTDDIRMLEIPKVTVCALRFTESARARIHKAGGKCMTFDQLALARPTGSNTVLLRGARKARKAYKYFGAPGVPNSSARPHVRSKGRKFEKARGRRASRGYKI